MSGNTTNAQIASFITALRMKGETIDEITACAMVMRRYGLKLVHEGDVLDIVGTGGDEGKHLQYLNCIIIHYICGRNTGSKAWEPQCIQQMRQCRCT